MSLHLPSIRFLGSLCHLSKPTNSTSIFRPLHLHSACQRQRRIPFRAFSIQPIKMAAATAPAFDRLIRFETEDGRVLYGDLGKEEVPTREIVGKSVSVLEGDVENGWKRTGGEEKVGKLLTPLPTTPIVFCIGLNYLHHAKEANIPIPSSPATFTKPSTALAPTLSTISIHPDCTPQLDYEGELTFIISRDCKNVAAADYASYILGYTCGNDVSARNFQLPASVSGGQFGYAKSFDGFAPVGPCVVRGEVLSGDPQKLSMVTRVNGEVRQETGTDDMIFSVGRIVEHLSRGTTLKAGTMVMTGTPSGVGVFMEPKGFLKDGDEVEIYIKGIGSLINTVKFE